MWLLGQFVFGAFVRTGVSGTRGCGRVFFFFLRCAGLVRRCFEAAVGCNCVGAQPSHFSLLAPTLRACSVRRYLASAPVCSAVHVSDVVEVLFKNSAATSAAA